MNIDSHIASSSGLLNSYTISRKADAIPWKQVIATSFWGSRLLCPRTVKVFIYYIVLMVDLLGSKLNSKYAIVQKVSFH
jgi:hypothetical protein